MTDISLCVVIGVFDSRSGREAELGAALARYVVLSRAHHGCRNVDLIASLTAPGQFVVYEKWESSGAQQAHMSSPAMQELAEAVQPLVEAPPDLGLFEPISAHDLI